MTITDPTEIAKAMMDGLLPDDDRSAEDETLLEIRRQSEIPVTNWERQNVTMEELRFAVQKQRNGRAPGHDGIRAEIVKRAFGRVGYPLLCIVEDIFRSGIFPSTWKIGALKVFLKDVEKPLHSVKFYRPISLLPVMGKISERIITRRLNDWLKTSEYYSSRQHGFLAGRSTITAMVELKTYVCESERRYVLGLFLDISGAFDNAWWLPQWPAKADPELSG